MDRAEIRQTANTLLECETAIWGENGPDAMLLHLHRFYEVRRRLVAATPVMTDKGQRFMLRLMHRKAQTLRRRIEGRLAVRN